MKLLLVEDDRSIVTFVKRGLEAEGYTVDVAGDGTQALEMARRLPYALIVLDRMLPRIDGLEVCRMLRKENVNSLILMLTAKDSLQDRVDGLRGGADDYLTKPFGFDELVARIEALMRRGRYEEAPEQLRVGDLTLDTATRKVARGARDIQLTAKEFALLSYLMRNGGKVVSRTKLLNNVWDHSFDHGTKIVDVYVYYLRRKIDTEDDRPLIHTMRGIGYRIADEPPA